MTAPTPEQMRALADVLDKSADVDRDPVRVPLAHESAYALREAADQLEAVLDVDRIATAIKTSKDKRYGPSWNEFRNDPPTQVDYGTARMIVAAITAGTAPQEDLDE